MKHALYSKVLWLSCLLTGTINSEPNKPTEYNIACRDGFIACDTYHYFGRIRQWQKASHRFTLTNTSSQPVAIKGISTSCSCMAAAINNKTIYPEQSREIDITFMAKNQFGLTQNNATVYFTDPNICPVRLLLEADLFSEGPRFSPNRVHFNQIPFQTQAQESILYRFRFH